MSSNYTGTPGETILTVPMLDDGDRPSAQLWRQTLEPIVDSLADLKGGLHSLSVHEDFVGVEIDDTAEVVRGGSGVWSVNRTDGVASFATTVTRLVGTGTTNAPGILRIQTGAGGGTDSATVSYGSIESGLASQEPFHAEHFAAPGAFVEFRFRLGTGATGITFACGLFSNSFTSPTAQRVVDIDSGSFRSVSDNGLDPADEHSTGVAVPAFDWIRVRFKSVDALLDTTETYDAAGTLLSTVTHPGGLLDAAQPLHLGLILTQTSAVNRLIDVDLIQAFAPVER